jgi:acyl-ACP thioesterase
VGLWVHLAPGGARPSPFSERELELYAPSAAGRRIKARLHHPAAGTAPVTGAWHFRAADLDMLDHVNNAAYWQVLEERLIAGPEPAEIDAEIEYRMPAGSGAVEVREHGDMMWLTGGAEVVASIRARAPRR